jgi:hypothetical protein
VSSCWLVLLFDANITAIFDLDFPTQIGCMVGDAAYLRN